MAGNGCCACQDVQFNILVANDLQQRGDHALLGTDLHRACSYMRILSPRGRTIRDSTHLANLQLAAFLNIGVRAIGGGEEVGERLEIHVCVVKLRWGCRSAF